MIEYLKLVEEAGGYSVLNEERGDTERVRKFLEQSGDLEQRDQFGDTLLMHAAWRGHTSLAVALITSGADVNAVNERGETALIQAARQGHVGIITELIESGAELNTVNSEGNSALIEAVIHNRKETAVALVAAGADVNIQNINKETALMHALFSGTEVKAKKSILKKISDAFKGSGEKDKGEKGIPEFLLGSGADPGLADVAGKTALDIAAERGNKKVFNFIQELNSLE